MIKNKIMQAKDFMPLYIGCEMFFEKSGRIATLKGVKIIDNDHLLIDVGHGFRDHELIAYKPILSPISDMSEEQFKYIVDNIFDFAANDYYKSKECFWCRKTLTKERLRIDFNLKQFNFIHYWTDFTDEYRKLAPPMNEILIFVNWMRKNGFDMDGLLDSGMAFNKNDFKK